MNKSDVIPISPGSRIGYLGQAWIVEAQEDEGRVLARNVNTSHREFISADDISSPPDELGGGAGDPISKTDQVSGTWAKALSERNIRALKVTKEDALGDPRLTDHKKIEALQKHFLALVEILALPTGQDKTKAIAKLCEEFGYTTATAYRNLKIVKLHGTPESLQRAVRSDLGELNLTEKQREILTKVVDAKRFCETPSPRPQVLTYANGELRTASEAEIGLTTLRKFEKSLKSPREVLEAQGRMEKARNVGADPILSHRADPILSQGWKPTLIGSAVDKCRTLPGSLTSLSLS